MRTRLASKREEDEESEPEEGPEEVMAGSEEVLRLRELHERTLESSSRKKRRRRRPVPEDDDAELPEGQLAAAVPEEPTGEAETTEDLPPPEPQRRAVPERIM